MGLRDAIRLRKTARAYEAAITAAMATGIPADPSTYPIASPWSTNTMQRIVFEDVFGSDIPANTREAAMRLPAIARGRGLIVNTGARIPLRALRADVELTTQPSWITETGDGSSPQHRLAWTIDDLIFYGWSCWWRTNGADGFPLAAQRINQGEWAIDSDCRVRVNGNVVDDSSVIVFSGFHEGVLSFGCDVIRDGRQLAANVRKRLTNPVPNIDLHHTGGRDLTTPEIDALIDQWAAARAGDNGGVAYTSKDVEANEMGKGDDQLMIDSRNASAVDQARILGISAGMVDATAPKASLNYETQTGRNQEFVDLDIRGYLDPIAARLSTDDVVPHGTRVAFDYTVETSLTPSPTGPVLED